MKVLLKNAKLIYGSLKGVMDMKNYTFDCSLCRQNDLDANRSLWQTILESPWNMIVLCRSPCFCQHMLRGFRRHIKL